MVGRVDWEGLDVRNEWRGRGMVGAVWWEGHPSRSCLVFPAQPHTKSAGPLSTGVNPSTTTHRVQHNLMRAGPDQPLVHCSTQTQQ